MPLEKEIIEDIKNYCESHLPENNWYENEFNFISDDNLRKRIIQEFKAIRFAYKLYEGIQAEEENLIFQVRNQILSYASIYEAIIEHVLTTYYNTTKEYDELIHHCIPVKISIPKDKQSQLEDILSHDGKKIVPFHFTKKKKEESKIRFEDKCNTAQDIGLIHSFTDTSGNKVELPEEIKEIYSFRNGIHLIAEQKKRISYELELSKKAYRRMRPFIDQIKLKLKEDGKFAFE